jgi:hypothetical protein
MTDETEHVLPDVLRKIQPDPSFLDSDHLSVEVPDQDPLSPQSLARQTQRLIRLIRHARAVDDIVLVRSLQRELLMTRWALAKSTDGTQPSRPSMRAAGSQAPELDSV